MWHRAVMPLRWNVRRFVVVITMAALLAICGYRGFPRFNVPQEPRVPVAVHSPNVTGIPPKSEPKSACEICEARRRPKDDPLSAPDGDVPVVARGTVHSVSRPLTDNQADSSVSFLRDVRPILVAKCYQCHGPGQHEAGLRFDRRDSVYNSTASGAIAVVPGEPGASELLARVTASDATHRMPRGEPSLSFEEISLLRNWITSGAPWTEESHWAFEKPRAVSPPLVENLNWPRTSVDSFILNRLEQEGMPHGGPADRVTLIRRLSLDLIGLPPTPEAVDAFLSDAAPDATERLVDRLVASPHFGEKWAIKWLDLARYADTNGFEFDAVRTIWLYRDWLIDAFNRDLPYDQFTMEQVAGDLIPHGTVQQQVATGFMRCSPVAPDIMTHRFDMLVDRVNTLGTTWLGLTFSCAQCHDHKFDPMTQREFYRLYAILNRGIDEVEGTKYEGMIVTAESACGGAEATTLVLSDRHHPSPTFVKVRGSATVDGEQVQPGVPEFLQRVKGDDDDRLGLACWLIDEDNPLTNRVAVNRVWESLFGTGWCGRARISVCAVRHRPTPSYSIGWHSIFDVGDSVRSGCCG